jgi:nucleotide-binding universal stress UspA family protein
MKMLMAVDGSDYTRYALEFVAAHPGWLGPHNEITALTAVPEMPPRMRAYMSAADMQSYREDQAAAVLDPVRAFGALHRWQITLAHELGSPGPVIAAAATNGGFDLVIMGSHGHTALASLALGSVSAQVLARCQVPVLIVRGSGGHPIGSP